MKHNWAHRSYELSGKEYNWKIKLKVFFLLLWEIFSDDIPIRAIRLWTILDSLNDATYEFTFNSVEHKMIPENFIPSILTRGNFFRPAQERMAIKEAWWLIHMAYFVVFFPRKALSYTVQWKLFHKFRFVSAWNGSKNHIKLLWNITYKQSSNMVRYQN